ncbi:hypothetical protein I6F33_30965 [Bradyrhizobium sp. BRP20]|uniref:hypothetical protein n=1 Tax=unclassified Bradyrhizobium TaxID=2631580 RepID=UPI001CD6E852|nr:MULTISPECIES: hypothetical protein [unclassified Bradyrhizobium]MCA1437348.1 hypothetical protein [Bradyrhizobium sp. BRP20]MCA1551440.1 hypothetical protein [Bradyrhizobium sp. BRP19]
MSRAARASKENLSVSPSPDARPAALVDELHRNDPDLAAQTGFVQPEQAHLVRLIRSRSDDAQTFRQIVNDQDDKGTANFLFVTVNDGGVTGGGADWSLLLVDRRVPAAPVAYHYDSAGSHNSTAQSSSQHVSAPVCKRPAWPGSGTA